MNIYPRVLIVTHNSFDLNKNNGKTFNTLFSGWDSESIAQLYFLNEVPQSNFCKVYFRITDMDVLKAFFQLKPSEKCGQQIQINTNDNVGTCFKNGNNFASIVSKLNNIPLRILRDLLWSSNVWKTQMLKDWIIKINPEVIFWGVGNCTFSANIAYWISVNFNIPLCLYYGDDYVLNSNYGSLINRLQHKRIKYFHDRNLKHAKKLIAIGDLMASEYQKAYGKEVVVVRTGVDLNDSLPIIKSSTSERIVLSYFGGLHLNRWESIINLGILLRELQLVIPQKITLNIYSLADISYSMLNKLNEAPLHFCGKLYGNDVARIMMNSDILVHVESLDRKYRKLTSLSISTKIPEYLATGKCILGYGPHEVASMKLLSENHIGLSLTDHDTHDSKINKLLSILINETQREMLGKRAKSYSKEKFDRVLNNEVLRLSLFDCLEPKEV